MKSVAVVVDGVGGSTLEALALPSPVMGPRATGREESGEPIGGNATSVRVTRVEPRVQAGPTARTLRFVIDGEVSVTSSGETVRLSRGDVVLVDDLGSTGHTITSAGGAWLLDVEIAPGWSASGAVPAPTERAVSDAPVLLRMYVEDGRAHLGRLDELLVPGAPPQPVKALSFLCLTDGVASDWHTEEGVSLVVVLSGGFELEVGGRGGSQVLRAGDVCLVDDREGQGHITRTHGDTRFAAIALPADHYWKNGG